MFWFKGCPRCDVGDLYEGKDMYGSYIACLQCGYYLTEPEEVAVRYASRLRYTASPREETPVEPVLAARSP